MDLRGMLNDNAERPLAPAPALAPAPSQQPSQQPSRASFAHPTTPLTPAQKHPHTYPVGEFAHPSQVSPGKPPSQEFALQRQQTGSYPPQSPYGPPPTYSGRPGPPPLQTQNSFDVRSPGSAAMPAPAAQYRTASASAPTSGSYFTTQVEVASPVQIQPYPPNQFPARDIHPQPLSAGPPAPHGHGPFVQQPPMPQTPPIGTPGGAHHYLHQRSRSSHSVQTPTPTSAQSQQHFGPAYGSPVAAAHPQQPFTHQPPQPATPLGPPDARQGFAQPPSPFIQRMPSIGPPTYPQQPHGSPTHPHPHPPQQRMSSTQVPPDPHSEMHRRSRSHSERDRSVSISPKTRLPSVPGSAGHPEVDYRFIQPNLPSHDRAITPAKRKMDDRELESETGRQELRARPDVNGHRAQLSRASTSPDMRKKRRVRHGELPVWAELYINGKHLHHPNYELLKKGDTSNDQHEGPVRPDRASRHATPETARSAGPLVAPPVQELHGGLLGPWEPCITGTRPYEEIPKMVADWLFMNVVANPDSGEILSRGIQFEVEAKLGTLIDRDSNSRVSRSIATECILQDTGRVAFRSSMTEAQHKGLNDYLNGIVIDTDPRNPNTTGPRVQLHYKHRREVDKYFELPPALQDRIPGCVRALIPSKHSVKARVTYDQRTNEVLAKIVKARVSDLSLHFPSCPLDCRLSINLEMVWDGPVEELEHLAVSQDRMSDRNKDRLSYVQGHYQIDLTQVTLTGPAGATQRVEKEHELEIELAPGPLLDHGSRAAKGEPHKYQELIEAFVDNVRLMARKTREFP